VDKSPSVLWLGNLHFAPSLAPGRFRLERVDLRGLLPAGWRDFAARAGGVPDLFVLADSSLPPMLLDPHAVPAPTVFYSVDSHIHSWHPIYARAFDLVVHAQKDAGPDFLAAGVPAERLLWLPLFARSGDAPRGEPKIWDALFVGTVDAATTPRRARLLAELARLVPGLKVTAGDYRELYPKAKIVLNVAERGDLNFRVFEALACGACLLTPEVANGQPDLFVPGEDFFVYDQDDVAGLAASIRRLLADPRARDRAAASGLAKVRAAHTAEARARDFADWLGGFDLADLARERLGRADALFQGALKLLFLHWAERHDDPALRRAYLDAARGKAAGRS
jgi:hypothetical protein